MLETSTGIILVASDLSGVYRSEDDGASWRVVGWRSGLASTHIASLAEADDGVILAGTAGGLWVSKDGGRTFRYGGLEGYVALVSASRDGTWLAASCDDWTMGVCRLFKSTDAGTSWKQAWLETQYVREPLALVFSPASPSEAVILCRWDGCPLLYTSDGGSTWARLGWGVGGRNPEWVSWDVDGEKLLATLDGGGLAVASKGSQPSEWLWEVVKPEGPPWGIVWEDLCEPGLLWSFDPEHQLSWEEGKGLWRSSWQEAPQSWERVSDPAEWESGWSGTSFVFASTVRQAHLSFNCPKTRLYWATQQFLFRISIRGRDVSQEQLFTDSVDGGVRSRGLDNVVAVAVAGTRDGKHVYVGYLDLGIWRFDRFSGAMFNLNPRQLQGAWQGCGGNCLAIAVDSEDPDHVWASFADGVEGTWHVVESVNAGEDWVELGEGFPYPVTDLALGPDGAVLAAFGHGVARWDVLEHEWRTVLDASGIRRVAASPEGYAAGGEGGLYLSRDLDRWERFHNPSFTGTLTFGSDGWDGVTGIAYCCGQLFVAIRAVGKAGLEPGVWRVGDGGSATLLLRAADLRSLRCSLGSVLLAVASPAYSAGGWVEGVGGVWLGNGCGESWRRLDDGLEWPGGLDVSSTSFSGYFPTLLLAAPGGGLAFTKAVLSP